jgi:hypothetical protein
MNRRRFLVSAASAGALGAAAPWIPGAAAATDDELAYANFGVSAEFLLQDFYTRALDANLFEGASAGVLRRGRLAATQHAQALSALLVGAGQAAPAAEDFQFAWPQNAFATAASATRTGLTVLRAVLGAYQTAAASVVEPTYRVLYASLTASIGEQVGGLGGRAAIEQFPVATDLESASAALEDYLG